MSESTAKAKNDEQQREHTGLRTLDGHASARDVYQACHAPYPGTEVLRTKERLQARASGERVRQSGHSATTGDDATAAGDRSGERGVSL